MLAARGSRYADRTAGSDSEAKAPPKPKNLTSRASDHWDYIVPLLLERRTLTELDAGPLAMLCHEWGEYDSAMDELNELRKTKAKFKGHLIDHPRAQMRSAFERYSKLAIQFGLTPAAKSRIETAPDKPVEKEKAAETVMRIAT